MEEIVANFKAARGAKAERVADFMAKEGIKPGSDSDEKGDREEVEQEEQEEDPALLLNKSDSDDSEYEDD